MVKRKYALTPEELAELTRAVEGAGNDPAYNRLRAVLAYANGEKWTELIAHYRISRSTLLGWYRTYRRRGSQALITQRPAGTTPRLTTIQTAEMLRRLAATTPAEVFPEPEFTDHIMWTAKTLFRVIRMWYGVVYSSPTTYYSLLARLRGDSNKPEATE